MPACIRSLLFSSVLFLSYFFFLHSLFPLVHFMSPSCSSSVFPSFASCSPSGPSRQVNVSWVRAPLSKRVPFAHASAHVYSQIAPSRLRDPLRAGTPAGVTPAIACIEKLGSIRETLLDLDARYGYVVVDVAGKDHFRCTKLPATHTYTGARAPCRRGSGCGLVLNDAGNRIAFRSSTAQPSAQAATKP